MDKKDIRTTIRSAIGRVGTMQDLPRTDLVALAKRLGVEAKGRKDAIIDRILALLK